jgi:hypothetical protein
MRSRDRVVCGNLARQLILWQTGHLPGRAHKHEEVPRVFTAVKPDWIPAQFFFRGAQ